MNPELKELLQRQDGLVTRQQSLRFMTQDELSTKLGRDWQIVLPGIYATFTGALTDRQLSRAAFLHAGDGAMFTDSAALKMYGAQFVPPDPFFRLLVASQIQRTSRDMVAITRTVRLPKPTYIDGMPVAPIARALCDFGRRHQDLRDVEAVLAAVQRRTVTLSDLHVEIEDGPNRGRPRLLRATNNIDAGTRSVGEGDLRRLYASSKILPEPCWNWLIQLPDGTKISPDAMIIEAGMIHEVNGRRYHSAEKAGETAFEDMQHRASVATAAGLAVLGHSPRQIARDGLAIVRTAEETYLRRRGCGLPPGVVILRAGPPGTVRRTNLEATNDAATYGESA